MIEAELFDGTVLEFDPGTPPDVIQRVVKEQTAQRSPAATSVSPADAQAQLAGLQSGGKPAPPAPVAPRTWGDTAADVGGAVAGGVKAFLQGGNTTMADIAGMPVDLMNNAPRLANLLPGVSGVGPMADKPFGGSDWIKDRAAGAAKLVGGAPYTPRGPGERITERIGKEAVASILFAIAPLMKAGQVGLEGAKQMAVSGNPLTRMFGNMTETAAVTPLPQFARREAAYATAAGTGAGVANEAMRASGYEPGAMTDFVGSLGGVGLLATADTAGRAIASMLAPLFGSTRFADDVAKEAVANRLINSSTMMQERYGPTNQVPDTAPLVKQIQTPTAAEEMIPGFRADVADRARDPGVTALAYNTKSAMPGRMLGRQVANDAAVEQRLAELAPQGAPPVFREDLQRGVDTTLDDVRRAAADAGRQADTAAAPLRPTMDPEARGNAVRGDLQAADDTAREAVTRAYQEANVSNLPAEYGPLAEALQGVTNRLSVVERGLAPQAQIDTVAGLGKRPDAAPTPTGILDPSGTPIMRDPPAPEPTPLKNALDLRSELGRLERAALADPRAEKGGANAARVISQYADEVDRFIDAQLTPEQRAAVGAARDTARARKEAFTRDGDPVAAALAQREGGRSTMSDKRVAPSFVDPKAGSPLDRLFAQADTPTVRAAIEDEVKARIPDATDPARLRQFLDDYEIPLRQFPGLARQIEQAAEARTAANTASATATETERRLTTRGRSPQADYLSYGGDRYVDAMRTAVVGQRDSGAAVRELLDTAGRTPDAVEGARTAFWELLRREGSSRQPNAAGGERFNARAVAEKLRKPEYEAAARELWSDNPEAFDNIRGVVDALAGSGLSTSGKAPATSGTGQVSLQGKYDPALSASSIASRARSVNRGQMSPGIAIIDVTATWLRGRSAQMQQRGIDMLMSEAIENPRLAAALLEEYNPATWAAKRRMMSQVAGVRGTQILNLLDEATDPDGEVKDRANEITVTKPIPKGR